MTIARRQRLDAAAERSALVQGRGHLSAARQVVLRSNNDGVGDFTGLLQKLDYIAELGRQRLWLLPFYPSPRRDDGYDIADYRDVHPDYGTLPMSGASSAKRTPAASASSPNW